ncbi:MAG: TetR/AcrR family transcriptional regulator, partial [Methylophaga sp.]
HGFSIKQLAAKAGVATGTVYLYFQDRDALIRELHMNILQRFAKAMFADHDIELPLADQHHHLCCNLWRFLNDNPSVLLSKAQFDHLPPDILRSQRNDAWSLFAPLRELFAKGRQNGQIKDLQDDVLASLSFEPYMFLARQQLIGVIQIDTDKLCEIITASWDAIARPTVA